MLKCVLFDLDGTLLPMDQDVFVKAYFSGLAKKLAPHGYTDSKKLIAAIWAGTSAMVKNDGSCSNEEVFWAEFTKLLGEECRKDEPVFRDFYCTDFQQVRHVCGFTPEAAEIVGYVREKGLRAALATNPIFPAVATESRIRWAGLQPEDFEAYTTYENASFSKPNPAYYRQILDKLGLAPEECLMVGNDAVEDTAAQKLGMPVFLLTASLINKDGRDISVYPHGDFADLRKFIDELHKTG